MRALPIPAHPRHPRPIDHPNGRRTGPRRLARLAVPLAVLAAASACFQPNGAMKGALVVPSAPATATVTVVRGGPVPRPLDDRSQSSLLTATPGLAETNSIRVVGSSVVVSAPPANDDGNLRLVFVDPGQPVRADQEVCATWTEASSPYDQQGVALRVDTDGPTRAVTVTKNVWGGIFDVFNVHTWDASQPNGGLRHLASMSLAPVLKPEGRLLPLPWRICARAVGDTLTFKVWPADRPEPRWDDGVHGMSVPLPAGTPEAGRPGWYAGHVMGGQHLTYTELSGGGA